MCDDEKNKDYFAKCEVKDLNEPMTYEEAKALAVMMVCHGCPINFYPICDGHKCKQALDLICEALERQIPKKPNSIFCPVCNFPSIIDGEYGDRYPYCYNCGQAIDWSEVEE